MAAVTATSATSPRKVIMLLEQIHVISSAVPGIAFVAAISSSALVHLSPET